MASADIHTITVNALPMGLHAASVVRRTTGLSNVLHQVVHLPKEGHRSRDKEDPLATSSSTKAGNIEEEAVASSTTSALPKDKVLDGESHTKLPPSQLLIFCQDHQTLPK